jgi:ribosomal protein L21
MKLRVPSKVELQDVLFAEEGQKNTEKETVSKDSVVCFVGRRLSAKKEN